MPDLAMREEADMSMKHPRMAIAVAAAALATSAVFACSSSEDEGSAGGGSDGKGFYVSKVHPQLKTSCEQCHRSGKSGAPVFLGSSPEASYTAIETFPGLISPPALSPIVQKGPHSGPALSQSQSDIVTEWLTIEVRARKLTNDPGTPKNLRAAFAAFGACMDYARWKELKLHTIARSNTEGNQGECRSCHNFGQASVYLSGGTDLAQDEDDNAISFLKMSQFPYVQRLVVGRVMADGSFEGIEPARRLIDKGTETQQQQANSHPRYALSSELAAALGQYVLETISNVNANRCGTVSLPDAGSYDAAAVAPPRP
jgi:hypothetical protein